jgi:hypothetical protein
LLFGVRLWASVCLALYVAFWLQLDNAYWAGTSAAMVCQPHLGASLRKGWFRMIGTLVGAVAIVVLTAWFPELDSALEVLAQGNSAAATARLTALDARLASLSEADAQTSIVLRERGRVLAICDALVRHRAYFDAGAST